MTKLGRETIPFKPETHKRNLTCSILSPEYDGIRDTEEHLFDLVL